MKGYSRTSYGRTLGADLVSDYSDFKKSFPILSYQSLGPYLQRIRAGDYAALLPEPVVRWVMTRGTTGKPKQIPTTETHLGLILLAGARAFVNFGLTKKMSVLERPVLNLNFPSEVSDVEGSGKMGYSSGTYARLNPGLGEAKLVPAQEEIDSLGAGISVRDWESRYELAYQRAKGVDMGSTMGVTPVILGFARFLRKKHGTSPKILWHPDALFCTSVAKIHAKYGPELRHLFGPVPIVEMYSATEGVFAQQKDDLPYVSPNYDAYLFEARVGRGTKMLHELNRGEWGSLVVSTPLFPRYEIGDLIEAEGKGYFRVLGRAGWRVVAEHLAFNLLTMRGP